MTKERRLGRGLEALLGRPAGDQAGDQLRLHTPEVSEAAASAGGLQSMNVYAIESNPFQPRRDFDPAEIASLAASIQEHGLIQPIVVRRVGDRYQLISGERRLRAAIKSGWAEVPAQIREADDRQVAEIAIVENLQRKDLNALEKAASFQQYLQQYGCTQDELAGRLKIDRSTVANLIRLLELPTSIQDAVRSGAITAGHARALLPLGDEREQVAFCQRIQAESLSVRTVEELVQQMIHQQDEGSPMVEIAAGKAPTKIARSRQLAGLEQQFRSALGTKVDIKLGAKHAGKIVIHFANHDEFERLGEQIMGGAQPGLAAG